jgi:hypothetical protein
MLEVIGNAEGMTNTAERIIDAEDEVVSVHVWRAAARPPESKRN